MYKPMHSKHMCHHKNEQILAQWFAKTRKERTPFSIESIAISSRQGDLKTPPRAQSNSENN